MALICTCIINFVFIRSCLICVMLRVGVCVFHSYYKWWLSKIETCNVLCSFLSFYDYHYCAVWLKSRCSMRWRRTRRLVTSWFDCRQQCELYWRYRPKINCCWFGVSRLRRWKACSSLETLLRIELRCQSKLPIKWLQKMPQILGLQPNLTR